MTSVYSALFFALVFWLFLTQLQVWRVDSSTISTVPALRKSLIFFAGFCFLLFSGIYLTEFDLTEYPLAVGIGLGVASSVLSGPAALGFLIVLLVLRPWEILESGIVLGSLARLSSVLVGIQVIAQFVRFRGIRIFMRVETLLLLAFSIWALLSCSQAGDPSAARELYFDTLGRATIVYLLIVNLLHSGEETEQLQTVLLAAIFTTVVLALAFSTGTDAKTTADGRLSFMGLLGDPNDISSFAVLALPFALRPWWDASRRKIWPLLLSVAYPIALGALLLAAQSRGAILAVLVGLSLILWRKIGWSRRGLLIGIVVLAAFAPLQTMLHREAGDMNESGNNRIIFWKTAINMAVHRPMMGVGFGDYPHQYENFIAEAGSSEYGLRTAHSSWFLVLGELGFVGLFLFVGLFAWTVRRAWGLRHEHPEYFFAIGSYGVAMSFLSHSYLLFPHILFALISVAAAVAPSKASQASA